MSYVGIDLDACKVIFKLPNVHAAALLSGARYLDVTHMIFPVERATAAEAKYRVRTLPKFLCAYEQKKLYKNMTGSEWTGTFGQLSDALQELLVDLPMSDINMFEVEREVGSEPLAADLVEIQRKPFYQPLSVSPAKASIPTPPSAPSAPPSAPAADAPWLKAAPSIPSAPTSAPSAPPSIPSAPSIPNAPKAGSTTGRVWAIAEQIMAANPNVVSDVKEFRRQVITECEAQGINPGTAATQFGAWKRSKGL